MTFPISEPPVQSKVEKNVTSNECYRKGDGKFSTRPTVTFFLPLYFVEKAQVPVFYVHVTVHRKKFIYNKTN